MGRHHSSLERKLFNGLRYVTPDDRFVLISSHLCIYLLESFYNAPPFSLPTNNQLYKDLQQNPKILSAMAASAEDEHVTYEPGLIVHRYSDLEIKPRPEDVMFTREAPPYRFDVDLDNLAYWYGGKFASFLSTLRICLRI